jgi:hypothetical protein
MIGVFVTFQIVGVGTGTGFMSGKRSERAIPSHGVGHLAPRPGAEDRQTEIHMLSGEFFCVEGSMTEVGGKFNRAAMDLMRDAGLG